MKCPECGGAELVPGVKEVPFIQGKDNHARNPCGFLSGVRRGRFVG